MKVEEIITARIIEMLEKGTVPWHKPWSTGINQGEMMNAVTKKPYRGINRILTGMMGFQCNKWASYKQITDMGGTVRKGERGTPIVFYKKLEITVPESDDPKMIPLLRYSTVFNLEQADGIDYTPDALPDNGLEPIRVCEMITSRMPNRPRITYNEQRAYYRPITDTVNMPKFNTFNTAEEFYSTEFHELTHSTGHESRCNRKQSANNSFGSIDYSKEELVAEMGAAFLCGHCGIENKTIDNSASYIKSWLGKLRNDPKMVIIAAGQAQKAVDYILNKKS